MGVSSPHLSIIIPIYNAARYLEACLDSIVRQTYEDYEVIMVDDGSTDNSAEIAGKFVAADNRFILFKKPNGGQSSARNMALDNARGKYLTFVDSDDELIDTYTYSNAVAILEQNDGVDIVHFPYFKIFPDGHREQGTCCDINGNVTLVNKKDFFEKVDVVTDYMNRTRELSSGQWDKVFRASIFDGLRYETGRLFEDTYISCDLYASARSIVLTPVGAYGYYMREGSTTTSNRKLKVYCDQLDSQIRVLRFLIESGGNPEAVRAVTDALSKFIIGVYAKYGIKVDLRAQSDALSECAGMSCCGGMWVAIHRTGLYGGVARMLALLHIIKKKISE